MSRRTIPGWQVVLCDLALILFLTTLAATQSGRPAPDAAPAASPRAHEQAIYRDGAGGLSLSQWLAQQDRDPRAQVTVLAQFAPGEFGIVSRRAGALAAAAAQADKPPRVIVEPGARSDVFVSLAYDAAMPSPQAHTTRLRPEVLAR